ncbi:unnamed protein product [Ectocarpus fasciculatus]
MPMRKSKPCSIRSRRCYKRWALRPSRWVLARSRCTRSRRCSLIARWSPPLLCRNSWTRRRRARCWTRACSSRRCMRCWTP